MGGVHRTEIEMDSERESKPAVFTPNNEPYLGRTSVFYYDHAFLLCYIFMDVRVNLNLWSFVSKTI